MENNQMLDLRNKYSASHNVNKDLQYKRYLYVFSYLDREITAYGLKEAAKVRDTLIATGAKRQELSVRMYRLDMAATDASSTEDLIDSLCSILHN